MMLNNYIFYIKYNEVNMNEMGQNVMT